MPDSKPNILVIWGDDIGITNLSCYSDGLMGCRAAGRATRRLHSVPLPRRRSLRSYREVEADKITPR